MGAAAMAVLEACSESKPVAPIDEVFIVSVVYEVRAEGESLVHSGCQALQGRRDVRRWTARERGARAVYVSELQVQFLRVPCATSITEQRIEKSRGRPVRARRSCSRAVHPPLPCARRSDPTLLAGSGCARGRGVFCERRTSFELRSAGFTSMNSSSASGTTRKDK